LRARLLESIAPSSRIGDAHLPKDREEEIAQPRIVDADRNAATH
jgi:hypothetical protein